VARGGQDFLQMAQQGPPASNTGRPNS
jgi:hypothetical protein